MPLTSNAQLCDDMVPCCVRAQAVFATSERRKLALFEGQKEVWQQVEGLLAARTHRPAQELAMSRGANYVTHAQPATSVARAHMHALSHTSTGRQRLTKHVAQGRS